MGINNQLGASGVSKQNGNFRLTREVPLLQFTKKRKQINRRNEKKQINMPTSCFTCNINWQMTNKMSSWHFKTQHEGKKEMQYQLNDLINLTLDWISCLATGDTSLQWFLLPCNIILYTLYYEILELFIFTFTFLLEAGTLSFCLLSLRWWDQC